MESLPERVLAFRDFFKAEIGLDLNLSTDLLHQVLTHPSMANEKSLESSYERLEFLGDSIVNALFTSQLYLKFPSDSEGMLSRLRAALISNSALGQLGEQLALARFLLLSDGEITSLTQSNSKLLGRAFESLMGAIYLEGGFYQAQNILQHIVLAWENKHQQQWIDKERLLAVDVKSKVQELLHRFGLGNPQYVMIKHEKNDAKDQFEMALMVDDTTLASAESYSKKEAEKLVAKKILNDWDNIQKILEAKNFQKQDGSHVIN